jgi:hypothetical protein
LLQPRDLTRDTCLSVFSLALNGLDTETQAVLVQDYLRRNKSPKLAVIEVSQIAVRTSGAGEYAMFRSDSPSLAALITKHESTLLPWRSLFSLYDFNGQTKWRILTYIGRHNEQTSAPMNQQINAAIIRAYLAHAKPVQIESDSAATLRKTITLLEENGVRVVTLLAPNHEVVIAHQLVPSMFLTEARAALGQSVMDLSTRLEGDFGFSDPVHMNEAGRAVLLPDFVKMVGPHCGSK